MSDPHLSQELLDQGHRIAQLELKVAELYKRIGDSEPATPGPGGGFGEADRISADEHPRVIELVQAGEQIQAIKLYREIAGVGLAEAKDAVDALTRSYGPAD